jgi:hypothetical protein
MPLWNPWYRNRTHCLGRNPYKGVSGTKQTHTSMEHLQRGVWDKTNPHLYGTPTKGCLGQNKPTPLWNPYKGVSGTKQTHTSMEPLQRAVWDKANPHLYGTSGIEIGHSVCSYSYKGASRTKQTNTSMEPLV